MDEFLLRQRVTLMVNRYEVYAPSQPGAGSKEEGELVCFVEQKRMKLKEEINFFPDTTKTNKLFSVKAENAFDPRGRYNLLDPAGNVIARFKKNFKASFARSHVAPPGRRRNRTASRKERNLCGRAVPSLLGRLVPYIGDFLGLIPIAYNFDFMSAWTDRRRGRSTRNCGAFATGSASRSPTRTSTAIRNETV